MNRKIQSVLLAAVTTILLMTILPPVTAMSYDYSGGITKVNPVIRYEFLFTKSGAEINYSRLFLQYLLVAIVGMWLVVSQKKVSASLATRFAELNIANDKLRQDITESKYTEQQLKRHAVILTAEKEKLGSQIKELKDAEKKWHADRIQFERRVEKQTVELASVNTRLQDEICKCKQTEEKLTAANGQLQREIAEHKQLEESLGRQIADLTSANEKIQHEADKFKMVEEQFAEYRQKYDQLFKQHPAQVDKNNKRLQENIDESESVAENDERIEQSKIPSQLFNVKEMKSLAELAMRLSRK